jgi:hypothetical protein
MPGSYQKLEVRMPTISVKQLKGNYAENLVAEWLSRVCLVRPVASGTDIGIDLYCESVVGNKPFHHFWVQVKAITSKDISIQNNVETAKYSHFKLDHLKYWARQPIPVYVFLVPINNWPPKKPQKIYTIRITNQIVVNGGIPTTYSTFRTSEYADEKTIDDDLKVFVNEVVPADTALLGYSKGIANNIEKDFDNGYQRFVRGDVILKYTGQFFDKIRDALILLGSEAFEREDKNPKLVFLRRYASHLAEELVGIHAMNEMGISFLLKSALKDGNLTKANEILQKLTQSINSRTDISEEAKSELREKVLQTFRENIPS